MPSLTGRHACHCEAPVDTSIDFMKAALQSSTSQAADLLAVAAVALPAAALGLSSMLDQSMRRPSLAGFLIRTVRLAF